MALPRVPVNNFLSYTLDAQIAAGGNVITLNQSVAGIIIAPGYCVIDRVDTAGNKTPTKREVKKFTGVSGATLTGVTSVDGTDQVHAVGAVVELTHTVNFEKDLYDTLKIEHGDDGVHTTALVTSLKASGAEVTAGTEDAKIVTPKALADALITASGTDWRTAGTFTYASADAPTFVITVASGAAAIYGVGMRLKLTQATGGVKYFIITAVADTALTVYGGTDYTLVSEAITSPFYSSVKAPLGFPLSPAKWTVEVTNASQYTQATPTQNQWYNLNAALAITLPVGTWITEYQCNGEVNDNTAASGNLQATLSTANNSESDASFTSQVYMSATGASATAIYGTFFRKRILAIATKTPYYLNFRTINANVDNFQISGNLSLTILTAICAYL